MSIWFQHDNHTFTRLDTLLETLSVDEVLVCLTEIVEEQYGRGCVFTRGEQPDICLQWRKSMPWQPQVRALLQQAAPPAGDA